MSRQKIELVIHQGTDGELLAIEAKEDVIRQFDIKIIATSRDFDLDTVPDENSVLRHKEGEYAIDMLVEEQQLTSPQPTEARSMRLHRPGFFVVWLQCFWG